MGHTYTLYNLFYHISWLHKQKTNIVSNIKLYTMDIFDTVKSQS